MEDKSAQYSMEDNIKFCKNGRMSAQPSDMEIIAISAKDSFRRMARTLPTPQDVVLEIGCSTGAATRALVATGARVIAVDKSAQFVRKLEEECENSKTQSSPA